MTPDPAAAANFHESAWESSPPGRTMMVADVGNTRIKWGRCSPAAVVETAALPPDDPAAWQAQRAQWNLTPPLLWAVAGVQPVRRDALADWLRQGGDRVVVLDDPARLPLRVTLERPDHVGIDRLLDAVAVNTRRATDTPAVVIDAGSALTVDWLDPSGAFAGGAILPGLRLMAHALHDYTALLPLIEVPRQAPPPVGTSTRAAIASGIFWAVAGGVRALVLEMAGRSPHPPEVYLTGGDAPGLQPVLGPGVQLWSNMTLEGIRRTAEALT
jgi:type III pantothenate kinase